MTEVKFLGECEHARRGRRYHGRRLARTWSAWCWTATAVVAFAGSALAKPTEEVLEKAADAFSVGKDAFNDGDFISAASHFQHADSLAPNALVLDLAVRSYLEAGERIAAANLVRLGRSLYPDDTRFSERRGLLDEVSAVAGRVVVRCPAPCTLEVDNGLVHGPPRRKRTLYLAPGTATIAATWGSEPRVQERVQSTPGSRARVSFEPAAVAGPPSLLEEPAEPVAETQVPASAQPWDAPEEASSGLASPWFWSGVGLTAALLGASTWSALDARNNPGEDAVRRDCDAGDRSCPTYLEGVKNQRRTNVLWGASAGAAVLTAVVAAFTDFDASEEQTPTGSIAPLLEAGDGLLVGARGVF